MHTSTLFLVALASIMVTFSSAKPLDKENTVVGVNHRGSHGVSHQKREMRKRFSPGNSGNRQGSGSSATYVAPVTAPVTAPSAGGIGGGLTDGLPIVGGATGGGLPIVGGATGGGGLPLVVIGIRQDIESQNIHRDLYEKRNTQEIFIP
ncbi:hypothetical protein BDF21DRAFT_491327 [Thamnidium elegans]|nr:hypothetical protein BDF21DRAFT_491327 [Thamnidium elegans]